MTVVVHFTTVTLNHMQLKQPQILAFISPNISFKAVWGFLYSIDAGEDWTIDTEVVWKGTLLSSPHLKKKQTQNQTNKKMVFT